tara:strand:+ start:985 stop:1098 length:114 start_codon:yes stop_codon:yes gene_type:complete
LIIIEVKVSNAGEFIGVDVVEKPTHIDLDIREVIVDE